MTAEETLNINAEIIRTEFEESGWAPDRRSLEGAAMAAAGKFAKVSDQRIVSIESKQSNSGSIQLTATDANGGIFILFIGGGGGCDRIEDADGNVVYAAIM